jgi:hypothetical protein
LRVAKTIANRVFGFKGVKFNYSEFEQRNKDIVPYKFFVNEVMNWRDKGSTQLDRHFGWFLTLLLITGQRN